jgi:hypothetical protein
MKVQSLVLRHGKRERGCNKKCTGKVLEGKDVNNNEVLRIKFFI